MDKNEIEKRMNAACDILMFLDQRIAQQVEQRLEREHEKWRCLMSDMIVEERERIGALMTKLISQFVQTRMTEMVRTSRDQILDRFEQMLDRVEAKLNDPMHRSDDDKPPSKH